MMCVDCGCGADEVRIDGRPQSHGGDARPDESRRIALASRILARNDELAADNRRLFAQQEILALNLVSSPGSGKTTLLERSIVDLKDSVPIAVIEGDQQTANDAARIHATGVPVVQVNTGKGCHLDAHMIAHALTDLALPQRGLLFIENVGNLVCPAQFDLGEAHKVVILSVTEGEDKPLKYPDMFYAADLLLINKLDLLPYVDFDVARCVEYARRINPRIAVVELSATRGDGLDAWYGWLAGQRPASSVEG